MNHALNAALSLLLAAPGLANDLYVDVNYTGCATGAGTQSDPFCSIATAVAAAVAGDTVHVAPGTYFENLFINTDLTLIGTGGDSVTIVDGSQAGTVIHTGVGIVVDITGLTITNGNNTTGGGGGLRSESVATSLNNSTIAGNTALWGGGLYGNGVNVTLVDSTVSENTATSTVPWGSGSGGGLHGNDLTLINSTVSGNTCATSGKGGGIYAYRDLSLTRSTVDGNSAPSGSGGGISSGRFSRGVLTIVDSTVCGNSAGSGGGVYWSGFDYGEPSRLMTFSASNTATTQGGGVDFRAYGADATFTSCTVSGNSTAGWKGGGIALQFDLASSDVTLSNTTISGNSAQLGSGGGIHARVANYYGQAVTLADCSISENTAATGGGVVSYMSSCCSTYVGNTILASNSATADPDIRGGFFSTGYNLIGDAGSVGAFVNGVNGDQVGTASYALDPLLAPLADNGGLTQTHGLLAGSPAIDTGDPIRTTPDQRGVSRPQGTGVDVGAFELGPLPAFVSIGTGLAGTGGLTPALAGAGTPTPGAAISFDTSNGLGGALGLLAIGMELQPSAPLLGGSLYATPQWTYAIALGGVSGVAGAGSMSFPLSVPDDMSLVGATLAAQAAFIDPGAALGVSLTNGLRVVIG
jgi:hypothetical protein